jgi:hypothetical protein
MAAPEVANGPRALLKGDAALSEEGAVGSLSDFRPSADRAATYSVPDVPAQKDGDEVPTIPCGMRTLSPAPARKCTESLLARRLRMCPLIGGARCTAILKPMETHPMKNLIAVVAFATSAAAFAQAPATPSKTDTAVQKAGETKASANDTAAKAGDTKASANDTAAKANEASKAAANGDMKGAQAKSNEAAASAKTTSAKAGSTKGAAKDTSKKAGDTKNAVNDAAK